MPRIHAYVRKATSRKEKSYACFYIGSITPCAEAQDVGGHSHVYYQRPAAREHAQWWRLASGQPKRRSDRARRRALADLAAGIRQPTAQPCAARPRGDQG